MRTVNISRRDGISLTMNTGKLKGPVVDQIVERFLNGTPLKLSGVHFQISAGRLTIRIESDDALQRVFEGAADERLDDARIALDKLTGASASVHQAAASLPRRYVLIERFSGREICEKAGEDGEVRWKPGYPSDSNLGADEKESGEVAAAAEKLKASPAGPMARKFLKGAPCDFSGVRFQISGGRLNISIESNDELQKVFEGTADERLDEAMIALNDLTSSSAAISSAVAPLQKRYVLTERFSGREICARSGGDGPVEWMPGYPVDTNVGADDEPHGLAPVENLMSTREALIVIGNLLLMIVAAAAVGAATYFLAGSIMPDLAPLVTFFAIVFFFHSFLGKSVLKTGVIFVLAAAAASLGTRYVPVFDVNYSLAWQIAGDTIGFVIGLSTGRPLAYVYKKLEHH